MDTFVQRALREMAVRYVNVYILQQGAKMRHAYLITRQMRVVLRRYQNLSLIGLFSITTSH